MLLLLWAGVCVAVGWDTQSVAIPAAVFFGGVTGCEVGLRVAEIVVNRVCQSLPDC